MDVPLSFTYTPGLDFGITLKALHKAQAIDAITRLELERLLPTMVTTLQQTQAPTVSRRLRTGQAVIVKRATLLPPPPLQPRTPVEPPAPAEPVSSHEAFIKHVRMAITAGRDPGAAFSREAAADPIGYANYRQEHLFQRTIPVPEADTPLQDADVWKGLQTNDAWAAVLKRFTPGTARYNELWASYGRWKASGQDPQGVRLQSAAGDHVVNLG